MSGNTYNPSHAKERSEASRLALAAVSGVLAVGAILGVAKAETANQPVPFEDQPGVGELMVKNGVVPAGDVLVQVTDIPSKMAQEMAAPGQTDVFVQHVDNQVPGGREGDYAVLSQKEINTNAPGVTIENQDFGSAGDAAANSLPVVTYTPPK